MGGKGSVEAAKMNPENWRNLEVGFCLFDYTAHQMQTINNITKSSTETCIKYLNING